MNRLTLMLCPGLCLCLLSCSENDDRDFPAPSISFVTGAGYTGTDTVLKINETVLIGIESRSMSDKGLTLLHTCIEMDGKPTEIDSGFNVPEFRVFKTLTKTAAETEKWSFYTRDRDGRQSDTLSLTLIRSTESGYGPILRFDTLVLGAQESPLPGKMLSLPDGRTRSPEEAALDPDNIWLLYYYDNPGSGKNTIASPGANIDTGIYDLDGWARKNTTRFLPIGAIPDEAFLSSGNDSLVLEHSFEFAGGKRKAGQLGEGDFYAFVTEAGKRGIFRTLRVEGEESGSVTFQLIIQE